MTELSDQAQRIYEILQDGNWHCRIDWNYSDGGNKRLTDINRYLAPRGQKLAWAWCDCGRHTSTIKKRKIVALEVNFLTTATLGPEAICSDTPCFSKIKFGVCSCPEKITQQSLL